MKKIKKTLFVILCLAITAVPATAVIAEPAEQGHTCGITCCCANGNQCTEIIEINGFSPEGEARIKELFLENSFGPVGEIEEPGTKNILCSIFGHKLEYGSTTIVKHNYYSSAPKCRQETYNNVICTRCDYSSSTLASAIAINCCP